MNWKTALFDVAWYTGIHRLTGRRYRADGSVLMLHRIRDDPGRTDFSPNSELEITPDFLRQLLQYFRSNEWDIISLDQLAECLRDERSGNPFVCFTFDDGYRDNLEIALPIFREFGAPMAIYLTTGLIDRTHLPWWYMVEDLLRNTDDLELDIDRHLETTKTATTRQKYTAFNRIRKHLLSAPGIAEPLLERLTKRYGYTPASFNPDLLLGWGDVRTLAQDELVTLGGHAVSHAPLSQLSEERVTAEMTLSGDSIQAECGVAPCHFCYPFGGAGECGAREYRLAEHAGYLTATTTYRSNITHSGRSSLHCIPRIPVKGSLQEIRYIEMNLSGFMPAVYNPMKQY